MYGTVNYSSQKDKLNKLNNYKTNLNLIHKFIKENKIFLRNYDYNNYKYVYKNLIIYIDDDINDAYKGCYILNNKYIENKYNICVWTKQLILDNYYYKYYNTINEYKNIIDNCINKEIDKELFNEKYNNFKEELFKSCIYNNNNFMKNYNECINLYKSFNI